MKTYPRIYLLIFLMLSAGFSFAQSEDELFHDAGYSYFEKDYPNAHTKVSDGLIKYPDSKKLKALRDLICEKWTCPDDAIIGSIDGGDIPPGGDECLSDSDGDGICDAVDKCPDKWGTASHRGCPDSDGDGIYDDLDQCPDDSGSRSNNGCPTQPTPPPTRTEINANLSIQDRSTIKWNNQLARVADQLVLIFTIQSQPNVVKRYPVTGTSMFRFCPEASIWQFKKSSVKLEVTVDETLYYIAGDELNDKFFPCNCP